MEQDIRWIQRYDNFHRACMRILEVTESGAGPEDLSELDMEGLIQRFLNTLLNSGGKFFRTCLNTKDTNSCKVLTAH